MENSGENNRNKTEKKRKERGPKYYRWDGSKYVLRKPSECGEDPQNPKGKIVPLGLKNILVEQNKWQEYVDYFEKKNIQYRIFDDLPKSSRKTMKNKPALPRPSVPEEPRIKIKIVPKLSDENKTTSVLIPGLPFGSSNVPVQEVPEEPEEEAPEEPEEEAPEEPEEEAPEEPEEEVPEEEAPEEEVPEEPEQEEAKEKEEPEEPEQEEEEEAPQKDAAPSFSAYSKTDFLYPELDDPEFNVKIAKHKEFFDTKYDGKIYDIKTQADILCNAEFELLPHQIFVKNFMSFNTPYNSLLMYFGLGSGKTCAAIGVAEETRVHMKQIGMRKSIFIVASPNVQDNFRLQLFDETKLKLDNGIWSIQSCVGEALLSEINPTYLKSLTKERIINQIKTIISEQYVFMGYTQFANFIQESTEVKGVSYSREEKAKIKKQKIKTVFNNRLIIIDEVHNIRITNENRNKKTAELLMEVVKQADNMRLLLLSATPMYNSHEEIIWLANLMNLNDKRAPVKIGDIFNKNGDFHAKDDKHPEGGRDLLIRKLTGYISYVRGENPYSFPFRVYPDAAVRFASGTPYPTLQMNGKPMGKDRAVQHVPIFLHKLSENTHQKLAYDFIIDHMRKHNPVLQNTETESTAIQMDSFGYIALQQPLEALNIVYPFSEFDKKGGKSTPEEYEYLISNMIGSQGLSNIVSFKETRGEHPLRYNYEYKDAGYGRIFSPENIGKYSAKIAKICEIIKKSKGIVLIYSQWIDAGLVPIALALEEMGFSRYGSESYTKSLFKEPPTEPVDALSMKPKTEAYSDTGTFRPARYVMITGDPIFSPNNDADIKYLNQAKNKEGEFVKVVLISKAAGEGVDFKNIRQVHVMEPWFNMSRIEQIIGRGVRNLSHCQLPFEQRNVEIYLHGTQSGETETADLYIYRLAEQKSVKIGKVTRVLKETAVDCNLNIAQTNFTAEKLKELLKTNVVKIETSSGETVDYTVGDKPFTEICDYMDNCNYTCSPNIDLENVQPTQTTYNEEFLQGNRAKIVKRIRDLFRDIPGQKAGKFFFKEEELIRSVNIVKEYPIEQIYAALTFLIDNKNEYLIDRYGRLGRLINHGEYYAFQPIEITDEKASIYERTRPVDIKSHGIVVEIPEKRAESVPVKEKLPPKEKEGTEDANSVTREVEAETEAPDEPDSRETAMKEIQDNYSLAFLKDTKITAGEKNWYKNVSTVTQHLIEQHGMSLENIQKYVVYHILDEFPFSKKMAVLNQVYSANWRPIENVDTYMKEYFDDKMVVTDRGLLGITLADGAGSPKIYIQTSQGLWQEAEFTQANTILRSEGYRDKYIFNKDDMNQTLGFMSWVEGQHEYVFKIRDLNDSVNKRGARVSQALSKDLITKINAILGEPMYTVENVKTFFGEGKNRLAVVLECLIREFQWEKKEDKIWLLSNEQVLLNGILKYSRKN